MSIPQNQERIVLPKLYAYLFADLLRFLSGSRGCFRVGSKMAERFYAHFRWIFPIFSPFDTDLYFWNVCTQSSFVNLDRQVQSVVGVFFLYVRKLLIFGHRLQLERGRSACHPCRRQHRPGPDVASGRVDRPTEHSPGPSVGLDSMASSRARRSGRLAWCLGTRCRLFLQRPTRKLQSHMERERFDGVGLPQDSDHCPEVTRPATKSSPMPIPTPRFPHVIEDQLKLLFTLPKFIIYIPSQKNYQSCFMRPSEF